MKKWELSQIIINWQHHYGRNNLPWQKKNNPYYTWISEIMLQQTQVNTVIKYFNNFIYHIKTIHDLLNTTLDKILYLWSGLGYYNRAHNIHKAAQIIKIKYNGEIPNNIHNLMKLPGIGRTTAGAILSFAYNFSFPILDGNIKRILIRFYNLNIQKKNSQTEKKLWNIITSITPIHNANKFNQGMMDLGALICKHKNPVCKSCPIYKNCQFYQRKNNNLSTNKTIHKNKLFFLIIMQYKEFFLLKKRKKEKIWKNLFCFPEFNNILEIESWRYKHQINNLHYNRYYQINYKLSNINCKINLINIMINHKIKFNHDHYIWYNLKSNLEIGIPQLIKNIILKIKNPIKPWNDI